MKKTLMLSSRLFIILVAVAVLTILIRFPLTEGRAKSLSLFRIYTDRFILYDYAVSVLFFIALYKAFKLLGYIGQNKLFSSDSANTIRSIKHCAILLCVFIGMAAVYIRVYHDKNDDPAGFMAVCAVAVFIFVSVATTAAMFEKKLLKAIERKHFTP